MRFLLDENVAIFVYNTLKNAGIKERKLEIAISKFRNNDVTIAKAAQIASLPLTVFMEILSAKKINFHYTINELEEEFEGLIFL